MPGRRDRSAHRPDRSNSRSWGAFAALAAVFTIVAVGRAQEEPDDASVVRSQFRIADGTLDKRIFGKAADRAAARTQLEKLLAHRLAGINKLCDLSEAQRDKLRLAGQGDIRHFFDRVERLRERARSDLDESGHRAVLREAALLHRSYQSGLAGGNSLFAKKVSSVLSPEQAARYRDSEFDWRGTASSYPNRLPLGSVQAGATVEAGVRVVFVGEHAPDAKVTPQAPSWVHIKRINTSSQLWGDLGECLICDVSVSIDSSRVGEFRGKIGLLGGNELADVPVSIKVGERAAGMARVLVVPTPFHGASTEDTAVFLPWLELVERAQLDVHYLDIDREQPVLRDLDLSRFDVVLMDGGGLFFARAEDFERLSKFARAGGRVVVGADHFMQGSVPKANEFVTPFGLKVEDRENGGMVQVEKSGIAAHELTDGIEKLGFFRASPLFVTDTAKARILVWSPDPAEDEAGYVALAQVDRGEVILLGSSLWWLWIAREAKSEPQNARLLRNLLTSGAAGKSKRAH